MERLHKLRQHQCRSRRVMSRASSLVASPGSGEPWLVDPPRSARSEATTSETSSKSDALARPDRVLRDPLTTAVVSVTEALSQALRKRRNENGRRTLGQLGLDIQLQCYDRAKLDDLLSDLTVAGGLFCTVDSNGEVRESYEAMNVFAADVLQVCFDKLPDDDARAGRDASANRGATAFQAVYKARAAREQVQAECRVLVEKKTAEEIHLTRRLIRTAIESRKPVPIISRGGLTQAGFFKDVVVNDDPEAHPEHTVVTVMDAPAPSDGLQHVFAAKKLARAAVSASRAGSLAETSSRKGQETLFGFKKTSGVDPGVVAQSNSGQRVPGVDAYDDSVLGVTTRAVVLVRGNVRVLQQILEFLLGYASAVDPWDLDDIDAGSRGLRATKGHSLKALALKYAAELDTTLPERHKGVLTTLIKNAAESHHGHANLGAESELRYEIRPFETAGEVGKRNRNQWTRTLFPASPWPAPPENSALLTEKARSVTDGALGATPGSVANPTDPKSGIVGVRKENRRFLTGGGDFPGSVSADDGEGKRIFSQNSRERERPGRVEPEQGLVLGSEGAPTATSHVSVVHSHKKEWGEQSGSARPSWL